MGDRYVPTLGFRSAQRFLRNRSSVQTLQKSFGRDCKQKSYVYACTQKKKSQKITYARAGFGGLRKHRNSRPLTKGVRGFKMLKLHTTRRRRTTKAATSKATTMIVNRFLRRQGVEKTERLLLHVSWWL